MESMTKKVYFDDKNRLVFMWRAEMRHNDHNRTGQKKVGTKRNDPQTSRNRRSLNSEAI